MMPHFSPRGGDPFRMSRSPPAHSSPPHYRHPPGNILPSIESVFGDLGRRFGSIPPPVHTPVHTPYPSSYSPESPIRTSAPHAITQYICSSDEPWTIHKQGQKHPLPPSSTIHYPKPSDYPAHSSAGEFPEFLRPGPYQHGGHGHSARNRPCLASPQRSPTSETAYSPPDFASNVNDSEANTEICSDQGESEFTSGGICDTHSQAGSSVSQMYMKQFVCRTCKSAFKCDSLLRKHEMKHTKPFRCVILGCKRQGKGFTSANDRDRHMNSVHKRSSGRGAPGAVGYDCVYDHCRDNGKIFWRLDNFRNHLKKKHGTKEEQDEFLKRAETECRRVYSHQQAGIDSAMDTQSEPGGAMPLTAIESPGPASTDEFPMPRQAKRSRLLPPVPRFGSFGSWSDSEGLGVPISPVSRGPHKDLVSDATTDQMDLDEPPAVAESVTTAPPRVEGISGTERPNGSQITGAISRTNPKASFGRQDQGKVGGRCGRQDLQSEERLRRLDVLLEEIKKYPKILDEYHSLVRKEREENGDGQDWPQYQYLYPVGGSDISAQTMSVSKARRLQRSQSKDRVIARESQQLDRIEEGDPDRMEHGPLTCRTLRHNNSESRHHAIRQYVGQSPTDESPMSRLLLSSGGGTATSRFSSSDTQGPLISPPISVASPQAAVTEQRQSIVIPDDETPAPESRTQRRTSASTPTHTLVPNEKSTICPECDKRFTMPSKLKKHMKRHSRPFACTFRGCGKLFGSKGDWKRHENSQHFQLELWKCGVIPDGLALCGKLSFRRESHTTHLRNVHSITDKAEIATKTKEAHIGRNNFKTFWCGFCEAIPGKDSPKGRVVPLNKKGLDGWDERFDHLGKHFIDDGLNIDKYEFHDDDDQYGQQQSSSDDEDDGEVAVVEPARQTARSEDDVLGGGGGTMADEKVLEFTEVDDPNDRLAKKTLKVQRPQAQGNCQIFWYCCGGQNSGRCPDPGPYSEVLHGSCVACDHQCCPNCQKERSLADKEGGVLSVEVIGRRA